MYIQTKKTELSRNVDISMFKGSVFVFKCKSQDNLR